MDPATHTLTGAALAAAGLRRATPLATAALLIGANIPDVDIVSGLAGPYATLALRRGWTHGLLAIVAWPLLLTAGLLLWDRRVRRRNGHAASPARAGPLLAVAAVAVLSHAILDWLNNYGIRLLMPFDRRWFYGDALFIIDPWVWLVLGGALFPSCSRRTSSLAGWAVFWLAASLLVLLAPHVPLPARGVWVAGLAAMIAARAAGRGAETKRIQAPAGANRAKAPTQSLQTEPPMRATRTAPWAAARHAEISARLALAVVAAYMAAEVLANVPARAEVARIVEQRGLGHVERVSIGPVPANPFGGSVVVETSGAYLLGRWSWLAQPRFTLAEGALPKLSAAPVVQAASTALEARRFLTWSRFPYAEVEMKPDGYTVRFADARYAGTQQLAGPTVLLDRELRPLPRQEDAP